MILKIVYNNINLIVNENRITFSGSLIINNSDDYILLTLNDISE